MQQKKEDFSKNAQKFEKCYVGKWSINWIQLNWIIGIPLKFEFPFDFPKHLHSYAQLFVSSDCSCISKERWSQKLQKGWLLSILQKEVHIQDFIPLWEHSLPWRESCPHPPLTTWFKWKEKRVAAIATWGQLPTQLWSKNFFFLINKSFWGRIFIFSNCRNAFNFYTFFSSRKNCSMSLWFAVRQSFNAHNGRCACINWHKTRYQKIEMWNRY